jgi:hypothetical protein
MVTPPFAGAQDLTLLTTKLYIPPPRPDPSTGLRTGLVERSRLAKRLDEGLHLGHGRPSFLPRLALARRLC